MSFLPFSIPVLLYVVTGRLDLLVQSYSQVRSLGPLVSNLGKVVVKLVRYTHISDILKNKFKYGFIYFLIHSYFL